MSSKIKNKWPKALASLLKEWELDFKSCLQRETKDNPIPREVKVRSRLVFRAERGERDALESLLGAIHKEWIKKNGIMPVKECRILDVWSRQLFNGETPIREEQHKFYWLAKEALDETS